MVRSSRLALGGGLVAAGEAVAGVTALVALGPFRIALFLITCGLATGATTAAVVALIDRRGGPGGPPGGGPGGGPPDEPPPWWPDFERDFWAHVRGRERTRI